MEEITRMARPDILEMAYRSPVLAAQRGANVPTRLDTKENPYPPFPGSVDAAPHNRYPEAQPGQLLDRFAECFGAPWERMLIARGIDEATDLLVPVFCTAQRDAILVCPPVFGRHAISARLQPGAIHEVPLRKDAGFELDPERILAVHRSNPGLKVLFVCTILGWTAIPRSLTQSTIATATAAVSRAGIEYARANIDRAVEERRRVEDVLNGLPSIRIDPSDANFLLVDVVGSEEFTHRMRPAGIGILDCSAIAELEGSVRISIGTYRQNQAQLAVLRAYAATSGGCG
jgi:histidinol-phosphate/aromatic aminotransferase/cobyric acid decarboxylase-like protein